MAPLLLPSAVKVSPLAVSLRLRLPKRDSLSTSAWLLPGAASTLSLRCRSLAPPLLLALLKPPLPPLLLAVGLVGLIRCLALVCRALVSPAVLTLSVTPLSPRCRAKSCGRSFSLPPPSARVVLLHRLWPFSLRAV